LSRIRGGSGVESARTRRVSNLVGAHIPDLTGDGNDDFVSLWGERVLLHDGLTGLPVSKLLPSGAYWGVYIPL